jgi:hypothetical protein
MRPLHLASLLSLLVTACGGVAVAPSPTGSCADRGCRGASDALAAALRCPAEELLLRDLGLDRFRGTGCARTATVDCAEGCRVLESARALTPASEVAYRASFELLCAPDSVTVAPVAEGRFTARCRDVAVRYQCAADGCAPRGPVEPGVYAVRQREPQALRCLSRSAAELRIRFDDAGHALTVDVEGLRTVRLRQAGPSRTRSAETRGTCLAEVFGPMPAQRELAGSARVFVLGGPEARRPEALSVLAPPLE